MAMFIAARILDGTFAYKQIFGFRMYQRYQDDTDAILIAEGRQDAIDR